MDNITADEKLDAIDTLNEKIEDSVDKLLALCNDENEEIRYRALEALQCVKNIETEKTVYKCLEDQDELVRTTSLEILGYWGEKKNEDKIFAFLTDRSPLVRSAAAISLGQIGSQKYSDEIIEMLKTAESEDKVGLYYYLCRVGRHEYFTSFFNGLLDSFYRVRCATANLLIDLVDENNFDFVLNFLKLLYEKEETEAAKSSIKNAISELVDIEKAVSDLNL
jgi:HEAT repeat protein